MTILFFITIGLLGVGMVLVIIGTIVKNRWGINVDRVSCPRCNTPIPQIRKPLTLQQSLWGGGNCPACGVEVDKWGREVATHGHPHPTGSIQPEGQARRVLKRRLIIFPAVGYFCLTLLFDWLRVWPRQGGPPSTLSGWVSVAGIAAVETTIFTVLFYFATSYLLSRFFLKEPGVSRTLVAKIPGTPPE